MTMSLVNVDETLLMGHLELLNDCLDLEGWPESNFHKREKYVFDSGDLETAIPH